MTKIVREGIGDVYASKRFFIPDEFQEFNQEYEISQNRNKIIIINEKAKVIKNPSSLKNIAPDVRGIIDKEGNVYLSIKANCIHQTILDSLEDQGLITVPYRWYQDLPTEFISIQRVGNTDIIAMGESNLVLDEYRNSFTEEQIQEAYLPIINKAKKLNPNLNIQFGLVNDIRRKLISGIVKENLEPMNYIPSFEEILKAAPKEIQDYLSRCGNTPQSAHWHPEGDVLKHINIVYNRARKTGDMNNAMAALFHDLGKADVTKQSFTKPGAWPAHGHEFVSAKLVEKHKEWIQSIGADWKEVYEMVKEHMRVKKIHEMRPSKQEELRNNKYFSKINNFSQFDDMTTLSDEELQSRKFILNRIHKYLNETTNNEIKLLQKQLKDLDNWFANHSFGTKGYELWDEKAEEANKIRRKLYQLTGDPYGKTKKDEIKKNIKPKGLNDKYDDPTDVPKEVYRWILQNTSLLTADATDAVRWSRIINTKDEPRYPRGEITIYRAVDNHNYNEIRPGDWVTTYKEYAIEHNNRYFDGKGKIISMDVDGRDVLVSPTGNYEEAIYAPLKYSIDVKL